MVVHIGEISAILLENWHLRLQIGKNLELAQVSIML